MQILIASSNASKVARIRRLVPDVEFLTPKEAGVPIVDIEEGSDIFLNARNKALAYRDRTDLPILGLDTAFVIPGTDLDAAKVKRNALEGRDERSISQQEIAQAMIAYYRELVRAHGGPMPAYWEDAFALVLPDGAVSESSSRRPVTLTGEDPVHVDPYFPLRSIYRSDATGKFSSEQTEEEEALELEPVKTALQQCLGRS